MSLNWEKQSDGTVMATGQETVYLLRDFGPIGGEGRELQMECRVTGDGYPRVIVRGQVASQLFVEAQAMEEEGALMQAPDPADGGWYEPTASRTSTTSK
jgi:hypothetical protein